MHFADIMVQHMQKKSPIMLGIDPDFDLMPDIFLPKSADEEAVEKSLFEFSKIAIDCCEHYICGVKFQAAYFEQSGSSGMKALAKSIAYAKNLKLPIILDGKRGDIGTSSKAYATAFLTGQARLRNDITVYSNFKADALTINPYLGSDSLDPFVEAASENNAGLFILVKTSNPGSSTIQDIDSEDGKVFEKVARIIHDYTKRNKVGACGFSHIGAVIGATYPAILKSLRSIMPKSLFLMPGIGAQGSTIESVSETFQGDLSGIILPISRGLTYVKELDMSLNEYQKKVKMNLEQFYNRIELV